MSGAATVGPSGTLTITTCTLGSATATQCYASVKAQLNANYYNCLWFTNPTQLEGCMVGSWTPSVWLNTTQRYLELRTHTGGQPPSTDEARLSGTLLDREIAVANPYNLWPNVELVTPLNGARLVGGQGILLAATASDPDGSIAKVEFWGDSVKLGEGTWINNRYEYTWTGVASGSHSIRAYAYDNRNASSKSALIDVEVNFPPLVSLNSPSPNAIVQVGAPVLMQAAASDPDTPIGRVEFLVDGVVVGSDTWAPYSYSWTSTAGAHSLAARAIDQQAPSPTTLSSPVSITVNRNPTVSITSPAAGSSFPSGQSISLTAAASDPDAGDSIMHVDFYDSATFIARVSAAPYTTTFTGAAIGAHDIVVRAYDHRGGSYQTPAHRVNVTQLPPTNVRITSHSNGAVVQQGQTVTLVGTALDPEGGVMMLRFYDGTQLLGNDNSAAYTTAWHASTAGVRLLRVEATDDGNATTVSPNVSVYVNAAPLVTIESPAPTPAVQANQPVAFVVNATDGDGISKVEFFRNGSKIGDGVLANGKYGFSWTNAPTGAHTIMVRATDTKGGVTERFATFTVNAQPTISITSPAPNAVIPVGSSVTIQTYPQDSDGTVTRVDFYIDGVFKGYDSTAPFTYTWTGVTSGPHSLVAKATDIDQGVGTSATVPVKGNTAPQATITVSPTNAFAGDTVTITAAGTDAAGEGAIKVVQILDGETVIAQQLAASLTLQRSNFAAGTHVLSSLVTDADNATHRSAPVTLTVSQRPPTVALTNLAANQVFPYGQPITFTATASDPDGSIVKVEFYANGSFVGSDAYPNPYSARWEIPVAGAREVFARAIDNEGAHTDSTPVTIIVNLPPTLSEYSVTPAVVGLNAAVDLRVKAVDSDGAVETVVFKRNGTALAAPARTDNVYSTQWAATSYGTFDFIAEATDDRGTKSSTTAKSVKVNRSPALSFLGAAAEGWVEYDDAVTLTVAANDPDGQIAYVAFYADGVLLGSDGSGTDSLYHREWTRFSHMNHELKAVAFDDNGFSTTITTTVTVNTPPSVALSGIPASGVMEGDAYRLTASVSDLNGDATLVKFYDNGTYLGQRQVPQVAPGVSTDVHWDIESIARGSHVFTAVATDARGSSRTSVPLEFDAGQDGPTIVWEEPGELNQRFLVDEPMRLSVMASDPDGVASVTFYVNGMLAGSDAAPANGVGDDFSINYQPPITGNLRIRAIAADTLGAISDTYPENDMLIVVHRRPHAHLASPEDNAELPAGLPYIDFNVVATDDGMVKSIRLRHPGGIDDFNDPPPCSLDEIQTVCASARWDSPTNGIHEIEVSAVDNNDVPSRVTKSRICVGVPCDAPRVSLTSPVNTGWPHPAGDILVAANVETAGEVEYVDLFANGAHIARVDDSPYEATYDASASGTYTFMATAKVVGHDPVDSEPVSIEVQATDNAAPVITQLVSPEDNQPVDPGSAIVFQGTAEDSDGRVESVTVRSAATGAIVGTDNSPAAASANFSVQISVPAETTTYSIIAYDEDGAASDAVFRTLQVADTTVSLPERDATSDAVGSTAGEFRVDESGNATYRIPIAVVPGTAGVAPQIALAYSSQGGPSPIGKGWTLAGQSSIARCRKSHEAGDAEGDSLPVQFSNDDAFCLDGQRLIAVNGGTYGANNTEYRLELDPWTRITSKGGSNDESSLTYTGPAYFLVERKDGSTSEYGNSPDSNIRRNSCPGACATSTWALNRFEDSTGNYLTWHYTGFFGGLPVTNPSSPVDEFLPLEVRYTGKRRLAGQAGVASEPYARVRFAYVPLAQEQQHRGWQSGSLVSRTQRMTWIKVQDGAEFNRTIRYYELTAGTSDSNSGVLQLDGVTECNKADGDLGAGSSASTAPVCYAPTTFTHSTAKYEFSQSAVNDDSTSFNIKDRYGARIGDVDGDGRQDLVWVKNVNEDEDPGTDDCQTSRIFVSYGDRDVKAVNGVSNSFLAMNMPSQTGICTGRKLQNLEDSWQLLDYDGDGRDDLMMATAAGTNGRWKIHRSAGRPDNGGKVFDDSVDLLDVVIPVTDESLRMAQLIDLNGDGLLDVVYPAAGDTDGYTELRARLREPANGLKFGNETTVQFEFLEETGGAEEDPCRNPRVAPAPPGQLLKRCDYGFRQSPEARFAISDFDGDGRGDLMLLVGRRYEDADNATGEQPPFSVQYMDAQSLIDAATAGSSPFVEYTMHWYFFASRTEGGAVHFKQLSQIPVHDPESIDQSQSGDLPLQSAKIRMADFNGDGLTDLLYRRAESTLPDSWRLRQNDGRGFTWDSAYAEIGNVKNSDHAQVADINGDGRADLLYPPDSGSCAGETADTSRPFCVRSGQSHAIGLAGAVRVPGGGAASIQAGRSLGDFEHFFADFDGDGSADFLRMHRTEGNREGVNGGGIYTARSATRHQLRDAIVEIEDGLGAKTFITYAPLTNASVYRRDTGSLTTASFGRGSPTFDLLAPIYVASRVRSSAPIWTVPDALAEVNYRYAGGKMQSGGRGFLGFREIASYDGVYWTGADEHVVTLTSYRQDFPFVGHPTETRKHVVAGEVNYGNLAPEACRGDPEALAQHCFYRIGEGFGSVGGTVVTMAKSHWGCEGSSDNSTCATTSELAADVCGLELGEGRVPLGSQQPVFAYLAGTEEETYSPESGGLLASTTSAFCYWGNYGNLTQSTVRRFDGSGTQLTEQSTLNSYENVVTEVDSAQPLWRLGRLLTTRVQTDRPHPGWPADRTTVTRFSDFAYDTGAASTAKTGLLVSERLQKDLGADEDLRTLYNLDQYGNKTHAFTCSAKAADQSGLTDDQCRNASLVMQQPGDPSVVHRYARSTFDDIGRYLTATYAPYYSASTSSHMVERASLIVHARDEFGNAVEQSDANGTKAFARYGAMGRPYASADETGKSSVVRYRRCSGSLCPRGAVYRAETQAAGAPTQWTYHDVLGRTQLSVVASFEAGVTGRDFSAKCTFFDEKNRGERTSTPFFLTAAASGGAPTFPSDPCASRQWSTVLFDVLGRVVASVEPDGSETVTTYDGLVTRVINAKGQMAEEEKNALGEVVRSTQADPENPAAPGMSVYFEYNVSGKVATVTRNAGPGDIVTTYEYDGLGRLTKSTDPDRGEETFAYNAAGETIQSTRGGGNQVRSFYDARGRVWRRDTAGGIVDEWIYDTAPNGLGAVHSEERRAFGKPTYRRLFAYDALGRPSSRTTLIDGVSHAEAWFYDSLGRQYRTQDATGAVLEQTYTTRGYPWQLRNAANTSEIYQQVLELNARGQMTRALRGSVNVAWVYDSRRGWLDTIQSGTGNGLQNLTYEHDLLGNLTWRIDERINQRDGFEYDGLNRLETATTSINGDPGAVTLALTYDALGNICSKNGRSYSYAGLDGCSDDSAGSDANASPHAVRTVNGDQYQYSSGLLTTSTTAAFGNRTFGYNGLEQLQSVAVGAVSAPTAELELRYGPSGERYWREETVGGARTLTRTVGNVEYITRPNAVVETKRYIAGVLIETSFSNGAASTQRYLFHDGLGSVDVITDALGTVQERQSFNPHGERRNALDWRTAVTNYVPSNTTRGFTGHEHLDVFGLVHMNGRVYEPTIGRFIQADPVLDSGIQGLNRYSYVLNNPMTHTDPSGHWSVPTWVRAAAAIAITVYTGGTAAGASWGAFGGATLSAGQAFAVTVAGGFAAGAVQSGSLEGGLYGAFSAAAFYGVGSYFEGLKAAQWGTLTDFQIVGRVVSHGVVGGVMNDLQGGKFGHGFLSAGATQAFADPIDSIGASSNRIVASAVLGGTISAATGGKFANGAIAAAFSRAFNDENHDREEELAWDSEIDGNFLDPGEYTENRNAELAAAIGSLPEGNLTLLGHAAAGTTFYDFRLLPDRFARLDGSRVTREIRWQGEDLVRHVRSRYPNLKAGMTIVLAGCYTGSPTHPGVPNNIAQFAANQLKVNVVAPTGALTLHGSGQVSITNSDGTVGTWATFTPRK